MNKSIEQMVEELIRHSGVWDETKTRLKEMLDEHKAGTLEEDDARYIEGLYRKVTGREVAPSGQSGKLRPAQAAAAARAARPANDTGRDSQPASAGAMQSPAGLIEAVRTDIEALVLPAALADRSEAEQALRREISEAIGAALDRIAERHEAGST